MILLRCCLPLLAFLSLTLVGTDVWAQTSVYGLVGLTNYVLLIDNTSEAKRNTGGLMSGAFYNFPIQSRLTAGVDVRGGYGFGSRGGAMAAAAFRIGFVPKHVVLRPYFQLGGGVVTSSFNIEQTDVLVNNHFVAQWTRVTSGALQFAAGLDVRLTDSFDLRALELGAAAGGSDPGAGSAFVGAGLVYHLPRRARRI